MTRRKRNAASENKKELLFFFFLAATLFSVFFFFSYSSSPPESLCACLCADMCSSVTTVSCVCSVPSSLFLSSLSHSPSLPPKKGAVLFGFSLLPLPLSLSLSSNHIDWYFMLISLFSCIVSVKRSIARLFSLLSLRTYVCLCSYTP